jgi:preprotein translocase subunit SecE
VARKRPGDDAAGDRPDDEVYEDAIAADDEPEDDFIDDEDEDDEQPAGRGGTAIRERRTKAPEVRRAGFFGRIGGFFREVVSELRKVIWPTRKELLTYTGVVIVFVAVVTAIVGGLDYGFAKLLLFAFGNK